MQSELGYRLVALASGVYSVQSVALGETFHPVIGPMAEAEALYVRQLRLAERRAQERGEFVIWDIGLGAAANALAALRATQGLPGHLRLVSFDHTLEPLEFAWRHAAVLGYFTGYEARVRTLLDQGQVTFTHGHQTVRWEVVGGDFPAFLESPLACPIQPPPPHAILFDAYSPARNPAMWTLRLFTQLQGRLDPARPCALATYSRSTLLRVTLLLAGWYVGTGGATGEKEETTLAANALALIPHPLPRAWLRRVRRSTSAEPLPGPIYRQAPLAPETWEQLQNHPQFRA